MMVSLPPETAVRSLGHSKRRRKASTGQHRSAAQRRQFEYNGRVEDLFERAAAWIAYDPDPATRHELAAILARARKDDEVALKDLRDRFSGPLEFGTAGLRGVIGAGESRMNRAVVLRTSW